MINKVIYTNIKAVFTTFSWHLFLFQKKASQPLNNSVNFRSNTNSFIIVGEAFFGISTCCEIAQITFFPAFFMTGPGTLIPFCLVYFL